MLKGRRSGLVTAYLEKVSGNLLEEQYRQVIAKMIRGNAGVYALYKGDKLYYVGLANNLMRRVKQHLKDRHAKRWDRFSVYLASAGEHIKPLESLLLRIAMPSGNRVRGRLSGAVDQRKALYREMRDHDATRHAALLGGNLTRRRLRKKTSGSQGTRVLDGQLVKRIPLRAEYNGELYLATLRKDGYIGHAGVKHESPSAAARVITGRNVNGWQFWKYRAAGKGWVVLSNLRR